MFDIIFKIVTRIKNKKPLILNVTNEVTMNFVANGLLSLGASPMMSKAWEEIDDLVRIADSIVINIGTLDANFVALSEAACLAANKLNKPLILDPVGAGASRYRTAVCEELLTKYRFTLIKANASEIMALSNDYSNSKGVDSMLATCEVTKFAQHTASLYNVSVVVSGKTDAIISSDKIQLLERGSAMLSMVTGGGCLLSSIISAFNSVYPERYIAAYAAVYFYSVCSELAAARASGPGTFQANFLDQLSKIPEKYHYEIL